nr:hypothetical protein B0A51_00076 [Rachicladosporium sp. CCFEE 5018]
MRCADGLDFLKPASDGVKAKILDLGLKDSLEQCGKSCKELNGEMKGDMKSLRAKWRVQNIESISREAQQQQERAALLAAELEKQNQEEYDDDRDLQLQQVNGEMAAHQLLLANCAVASDDLKQLAIVSVKLKDVYAEGAGSSNAAGVSKDVIDKLKEARIEAGKMTAKSGGKNQIGIF